MSDVFDALAAGDTNGVLSSSKAFVAAVHTRDLRMAKTSTFSFDVHSSGWRSQLRSMPRDRLEAVQEAAASISGRAADPVIAGIRIAAGAELLLRTARDMGSDGAEFVLSGLSRDQLRELRNAASHFLANAPKPLSGADPGARVPGIQLTRNGLETLFSGLSRQLAIKTVLAEHLTSAEEFAAMPSARFQEVAWAVKQCGALKIAAPHNTDALPRAEVLQVQSIWDGKLKSLEKAIQQFEARPVPASGAIPSQSSGL